MISGQAREPRSRRAMLVGSTSLVVAIFVVGAMVAGRARRVARAEELQILQGARKACKAATVELPLADYARKVVPKTADLPFTREPEAYLFYSGIVSAGFDGCEDSAGFIVDHPAREVRVTLQPPRILSIDILRFEIINEQVGFLNAIAPADRNRWYSEARAALDHGARSAGALERASTRARDVLAAFVERHGYTLVYAVDRSSRRADEGTVR